MEHPSNRGDYNDRSNSNLTVLIGALIVILAVIGYFVWAGGYWGGRPMGNNVTAQTPTRQQIVPNKQLPANNPNVTPSKPVNNTPATSSPRPQ